MSRVVWRLVLPAEPLIASMLRAKNFCEMMRPVAEVSAYEVLFVIEEVQHAE